MGPVAGAFVGYAVAFLGTLGASVLAGFLLLALHPGEPPAEVIESLPGLLAGGFASSSTLLVVALLGTRSPRGLRLRLVAGRASGAAILVMAIGVLALGQALESLAFVLGLATGGALEAIRSGLAEASGATLALAVLGIGVYAGFAEELFFRGFMQTRLRERWRPWVAITVTALGFGILHLDRVHATLAFFLGLYLGFLAERSRSIVPAVICHVLNNTGSILLTALVGTATGFRANLGLLVATTAVFAAAAGTLPRLLPPPAAGVGGSGGLRVG